MTRVWSHNNTSHRVGAADWAFGAISDLFQVPLTSICYHGSRLVQALAKFKDRSLLLSSLRTLTPADLLTLATDPAGSHVLQALITSSSDKGRGKILKRLEVWMRNHCKMVRYIKYWTISLVKDGLFNFFQGQYVKMACSRLGSRVLEAVWNSSSVSHRQNIAQELGNANTIYTLKGGFISLLFNHLNISTRFILFFFSWMWEPAEVRSVRSPRVG